MFINNTNRDHTTWSKEQLEAAMPYGEIVDMIMPGLAAEADEAEADRVAGLVVRRILRRLDPENFPRGEEQNRVPEGKPDLASEGIEERTLCKERGEIQEEIRDAVLCQGDFTLVYRVVRQLKDAGVTVMAPTFRRVTKPTLRPDGTTAVGYSFDFARFREY